MAFKLDGKSYKIIRVDLHTQFAEIDTQPRTLTRLPVIGSPDKFGVVLAQGCKMEVVTTEQGTLSLIADADGKWKLDATP